MTILPPRPRSYRSIYFADASAYPRYLGWRLVVDTPGLRIITRRRVVVDRYLMFLTREGCGALEPWIRRLAGVAGLADIVVHDFDEVLDDRGELAGQCFRKARHSETLINPMTFVIDLQRSEDALLSAMTSDYRRKIRKAEAEGVTVTAYDRPPSEIIDAFITAYRSFANERGLKPADSKAIATMYADRRALLLIPDKNGKTSNYLHLYKVADAAIFMYGVNISKMNDGSGQYLHWQAIRRLKAEGCNGTTWGSVASEKPEDGIYPFKRNFGGEFVWLGSDWRHSGWMVERALAPTGAIGKMRSRLFP